MRLTKIEETTLDLDWFPIDRQGAVGAFATAGWGAIPDSVRESKEELFRLTRYFRNECPITTSIIVAPGLARCLGLETRSLAKNYLSSFEQFARRGLYPFDCAPDGFRPRGYVRTSSPAKPLAAVNLPEDILKILERKGILPVSFADVDEITAEEIVGRAK